MKPPHTHTPPDRRPVRAAIERGGPLFAIRAFAARKRRGLLLNTALRTLSVAAVVYLAISAVLGAAFSLYPWTALPIVWMAATVLTAVTFLFVPLIVTIRRPTLVRTATIIEDRCDVAHPSLSVALELSIQDDGTAGSPSLRELAYGRAAEQLGRLGSVSLSSVNKYVAAAVIILLTVNVSITALSSNKLTGYWKLPFALLSEERTRVEPGSVTVPLNSSVKLILSGTARHFPTARLEVWPLDGGSRDRYFLRADTAGIFSRSFDKLKESFVYRFSLSSPMPPETVTVVPPPLLRSLQVSTTPPRHTKLPSRELPSGQGNITAYPGTRVSVTLESNALRGAGMIFGGKDTLALDVRGKTATGAFIVAKSAEYTFYLIDTLGQKSDSLPRFMISVVPDETPVARILKPGMNKVLSTAQVETLWVEGVDDFGVAKMELRWRRSGDLLSDPPRTQDLSEKGNPPLIRKPVVWNIRELSLYPGDSLCYWLWVRDNKSSGGGQAACSDTFWFRMPSFEEIHKAVALKEQYAQEKLGEVRNRQDNIRSSIEKLVKSAAGSKELSWDQKRVLDDVKAQLNAQADSLQKALQALEDGIEAMREDGKLNEELFAKMEQVKKSVEELMKEFGENVFKMSADRELSMSEMRQAASKLKDMLPELSERLDQTLAFLEKMRQDKQLAELAVRAENLAGEQAELAASKQDPLIDKRQKELLDRIDGFNDDVKTFFKEQGGNLPSSSEQVSELSEEMRQQSERRNNKPDGGKKNDDKNNKNAMSRELMSLSEQLKSNLTVNMMAKMEADRKRILSMAHDALALEDWQQAIKFQALGTSDDRSVAFAQQGLGNAIRMSLAKSDSLTMVGSNVMREILRVYRNASAKSANAVNSLGSSDGSRQMDQSAQALREVANALLSIAGDDGSGDGSGGGGAMMSGLRRASGRQAALNSMIGDMLQSLLGDGKMPGGRQGQGQGRQMGQGRPSGQGSEGEGDNNGGDAPGGRGEADTETHKQAREAQKAIADELKRLADTYGKESGEGMERRVRELEQEARRLAQLLENPPADIVDMQDRFLSRMLQSTLSLNRKDEGKEERKGTVSQTLFSDKGVKAAGSGVAAKADSFHLLRKRAFEDNFPEEYRSAIREYFDVLGEMKWGEF